MNETDKRAYNIQRTKYDVEIRKRGRQEFDIATTQFDLKTAKQLVEGNFWIDDTDDDKGNTLGATDLSKGYNEPNKQVFLGREGLLSDIRLD